MLGRAYQRIVARSPTLRRGRFVRHRIGVGPWVECIGLDRGESGAGRIVTFQLIGLKVLMVQRNENFRSSSRNEAERHAVEDPFERNRDRPGGEYG
jgi:hypothetical protein